MSCGRRACSCVKIGMQWLPGSSIKLCFCMMLCRRCTTGCSELDAMDAFRMLIKSSHPVQRLIVNEELSLGHVPPTEIAHGSFYLHVTAVGTGRLRPSHIFLLQPQIHSRLSWLSISLLYSYRHFCDFCRISWTCTSCHSWRNIVATPLRVESYNQRLLTWRQR